MHHSFPKKATKDGKTFQEIYGDLIDSYANLIPTDDTTNKKYIGSKRPLIYYKDLLSSNNDLNSNLEKSFINIDLFLDENYEEYIKDRANKISKYINDNYLN